jgi:hypothetical protein
MKKSYFILTIFSVVFLFSCGLISDLIPDVETDFTIKYPIGINSNSGSTDPDTVDVENSDEYNDFKNNIHGYTINEIRFQISDSNVPNDLYFKGTIIAESIDGSKSVTVGVIERMLLSSYSNDEIEHPVEEVVDGIDQMTVWLDSPGKFVAMVSYELTKADGSLYPVEGMNYRFNLKIIFDVTVETGVGDS